MLVFYGETRIIFIEPNMMGSMDKKRMVCIPVYNNSCSSCIYYEITVMLSTIKIISCYTSIDDVDYHDPYFDFFCMKLLFHSRGIKEHHHTTYSQFDRISIWHTDRQSAKVMSCYLSSVEEILLY